MVLLTTLSAAAKAQNAEWFAADVETPVIYSTTSGGTTTVTRAAGILKVYFLSNAALTAAEVQASLDSGTTWFNIGSVPAVAANTTYSVEIPVAGNAQFQMRHTNASSKNITAWVYFTSD